MDLLVGVITVAVVVGVVVFVASLLGRRESGVTTAEAAGAGVATSVGCVLQLIPIVFVAMIVLLIGSCLWR